MALTHVNAEGKAAMVDVGAKEITERAATAEGWVKMSPEAFARVRDNTLAKGDVLAVARIAGVMAAKRTAELIPLCHQLPLNQVTVEPVLDESLPGVHISATARVTARTGVEMETLTAVSVAALTVYDMVKAIDRAMEIGPIRLTAKSGGRSGDYAR